MKILFVCMGNICRSPTAEGVLRHRAAAAGLAGRLEVDSAGTHAYHVGEPPDLRSQQHARRRGYDLSAQRARALADADFAAFDLILTMDQENLARVLRRRPPQARAEVRPVADFFARHADRAVPDPYHGGEAGFEHVLDLLEDAADQLIAQLRHDAQR